MNNIELEQKIKEIINIENYFDAIEAIKAFEKEYKESDFYKQTKMPLDKAIKEARIHYALNLTSLGEKIQKLLDTLDLTKFNDFMDQIGETFGQENQAINEQLEVLKDLKN